MGTGALSCWGTLGDLAEHISGLSYPMTRLLEYLPTIPISQEWRAAAAMICCLTTGQRTPEAPGGPLPGLCLADLGIMCQAMVGAEEMEGVDEGRHQQGMSSD
jgi:hypothetical protein